jgi:hypothetical protein
MENDFFDPYALFGLNEHYANISEARKAYYAMALDTHPDKQAGDASQFRVVHAAWKWIEKQLAGVPEAEEVVARFEEHKREWNAFLEAQKDETSVPALRDIVGEFGTTTIDRSARTNSEPTAFSKRFNAAWEEKADENTWRAFPRGGYGNFVARDDGEEPKPFPNRELVLYREPASTPCRGTCRHPAPGGVPRRLDDYGIQDANPLGCDYSIGLSAPLELPADPRSSRTIEDYMRDNGIAELKPNRILPRAPKSC